MAFPLRCLRSQAKTMGDAWKEVSRQSIRPPKSSQRSYSTVRRPMVSTQCLPPRATKALKANTGSSASHDVTSSNAQGRSFSTTRFHAYKTVQEAKSRYRSGVSESILSQTFDLLHFDSAISIARHNANLYPLYSPSLGKPDPSFSSPEVD
jgi:hypothetical protein